MSDGDVVILGGGQAASQLAVSLRDNGHDDAIRIVAAEPTLPYQRPPLSKAFLKGQVDKTALQLRAEEFYINNKIDILLGMRAVSVDRRARRVELASGRSLSYGHLVFATGSRNRTLALPGAELEGVCYLRSLAEAEAIRARLDASRRVVVVGGGFVGLELACAIRDLGASVVVLEAARRLMGRAVTPAMSSYVASGHERGGLRMVLGAAVAGFPGDGERVRGVALADGSLIEADVVLVGVGACADMELARDCGLRVGNGIEVDRCLTTSDPLVSAIGDCASFESAIGARLRLESVQNAVDQARCVAAKLVGRAKAYDSVPWFWSDQGAHRLQIAGLTDGHETAVIRGRMDSGRFSIFCYGGGRLLGVESMNQASDHMIARRLLATGIALSPEQAADLSFDLKTHVAEAARAPAQA